MPVGWMSSTRLKLQASLSVGRLGKLSVRGSEIVLGTPLIINKANIDRLNF